VDYLIHHMLRRSAERFPEKEALVHDDIRLSYADMAESVAGLAHGLREAGLRRFDRVGILAEPSMAQTQAILGASQSGGVFVPIHHSLFPEQVAHIIRDCDMTALVVESTRLNTLAPVLAECASLEFLVVIGEPVNDVAITAYAFDQLTRHVPPAWCDAVVEKDLAAVLYTSGSTGTPKGVMLSHANLTAGASIVSAYLDITDTDRTMAILPFSFDCGLNQLMTGLQQGATIVLTTWLFAKDIVRMLAAERITGLAGVPSLWSLLVQPSSRLARTELPHLRYVTNTGGALSDHTLAQLRASLPSTDVVLMYGLTEAFRSTYLPPGELVRRGVSMGKAIPDTEILVVNDAGHRCEPGEVGELVHHGPTVALGYWGQQELTAAVWRPHPFPAPGLVDVPKVVYSGDLVRTDEAGFLYFVGRRDNQIKCSGFRISPTEVEDVLCRSGSVQEAAVIGVPNAVLGEHIKAFVTPREGTAVVDIRDLLSFCSARMPRHMVPQSIEVVVDLPTTPSGKIDYSALRQRDETLA
jgi:acyl-CoA ligase (AMP-forming) (exosortase A-associated)